MTTALSVLGTLLILGGGWTVYDSLFMPIAMNETVNLSLMQGQTITFAFGAFMFLAGCVFMVGACVVHALTRKTD